MANGLFEQLRGVDEDGTTDIPAVSAHDLIAVFREFRRGKVTSPVATAALGLTAQSVADFNALVTAVANGRLTEEEAVDVLNLVQSGKVYTDKLATKARLGI